MLIIVCAERRMSENAFEPSFLRMTERGFAILDP